MEVLVNALVEIACFADIDDALEAVFKEIDAGSVR
jgi:hypothetical protein